MLKQEKTRKDPVAPEFIFSHCQITTFLIHWGATLRTLLYNRISQKDNKGATLNVLSVGMKTEAHHDSKADVSETPCCIPLMVALFFLIPPKIFIYSR